MSAVINEHKYRKLLAATLPRVIENAAEHRDMLDKVEQLMLRGKALTIEEKTLFKLMVSLIQQYEQKVYQMQKSSPLEVLEFLMEDRGHSAKDLWELIGDKGAVSRILHGQRSISKTQAKKLANFYNVSPAVFI